jgi:cytochrome P450
VIADIVGIPEHDRPWIFERTDLMLRALDPRNDLTLDDQRAAQVDLFGYAQQLTERKRAEPADDVWTLIAQAELTDDDGTTHRLEGLELEMFFVILAVAGSETTRNALSQGLLALLDHPDQLAELRARPELLPTAGDEIIRWSSPVLFFGRTATRDVELGGRAIAAGDRVVLWYPSANRDERAFEEPFRFDVHRDPNPHVSFGGGGPHYCLGANLAKKEVQVLTGALLDRFDVELTGPAEWAGGGPVHNVGVSVDHLPVRLTPRR